MPTLLFLSECFLFDRKSGAAQSVRAQLYVARSTRHSALRPWEMRTYLVMAQHVLEQAQPDIVLTYSSEALQPLLALASLCALYPPRSQYYCVFHGGRCPQRSRQVNRGG